MDGRHTFCEGRSNASRAGLLGQVARGAKLLLAQGMFVGAPPIGVPARINIETLDRRTVPI